MISLEPLFDNDSDKDVAINSSKVVELHKMNQGSQNLNVI